jgi:protein phosphatase
VVPVQAVRDTLATVADPDDAVRRLVDLANDAGGPDNVTCVVADVTG